MSAVLDLNRLRRTRRFPIIPGLDTDHYGTGAVDEGGLLPRVFRLPVVADSPEPAPTLQPPPALRARRVFTPPEFGSAEESALPPPPAPEGVDYQPGTLAARQRWSSPFNRETERNAALRDVLSDPSELPKAGKLQRWVITPLLRAAQGLSATGDVAGGAGGGLAGVVEAALNPQAATQVQYQRRLGESDANLGRMTAQRQAQIKQAGELADLELKRARTRDLLNPKPKEIAPHYETRDDGTYVVDAKSPDGRKLAGVPGRPSPEKARQREWIDDGQGNEVLHQYDEVGVPQMVTRGDKPVTRPGKQFVEAPLSTGGTARIPATEVYRGDRATEAANTTLGNQFGNQSYEDTVRRQERDYSQTLSQWEAAGREQARLVKAVEELNEATSMRDLAARQAADPNLTADERAKAEATRREWDTTGRAREQTVKNLAGTLSTAYRDFVEDDAQGWPTRLRPRPVAPAPPQRPAPQRRSVGAAPRQSAPRVSWEAFSSAARQQLGDSYDESKARAAYKQRYGR